MVSGDLRDPGHLPNMREGRRPAPPESLPRQRNGVAPQMRGRYPDYNVLDEADHWDELTRRAIVARAEDPPEICFFSETEAATLGAFCDTVLAQDREPKVPVLAMVDAKFASGLSDGFQYADMPPDPDTWRAVARGLDEQAAGAGAGSFATAGDDARMAIVGDFAEAKLAGGVWESLDVSRAWSVVMRSALEAFYSHPWAFNEIGFGGPAYPRGYARLAPGLREEWEQPEAINLDPVSDTEARGL